MARLAGRVFVAGCVGHCIYEHVGEIVVCEGSSMEPTIHSKDLVLTSHLSVTTGNYSNGDVLIVRSPHNPNKYLCKRLAAQSGDDIPQSHLLSLNKDRVPRGHVWLLGDNSSESMDSRRYGPIATALLRSKVTYRLWPNPGPLS